MYLAVYFVAVFLGVHLDELAVNPLEDVEDVPHQRRLVYLPYSNSEMCDGSKLKSLEQKLNCRMQKQWQISNQHVTMRLKCLFFFKSHQSLRHLCEDGPIWGRELVARGVAELWAGPEQMKARR